MKTYLVTQRADCVREVVVEARSAEQAKAKARLNSEATVRPISPWEPLREVRVIGAIRAAE